MGWKGTMRSVGAAVRAADREAKRRERERARQQKAQEKEEAIQQASDQVAEYNQYVVRLTSLHVECGDRIDWHSVARRAAPPEPINEFTAEKKARAALSNFKPGAVTKLLGGEERKRKKLGAAVEAAKKKDLKRLERAQELWQSEMKKWQASSGLARRLLANDAEAKLEAVREHNRFAKITDLGSSVSVAISDKGIVDATVSVHGRDVIPDEIYSQLQSGRLSVKKMPKGRFNELHQDYVCSCVLRVANEIFSVLPDEMAVVTATDEMLNSATGHLEEKPIVSACISRATLDSLNLANIDPSDSLRNFVHNMSFKKTAGFSSVEKVDSERIQTS